MSVDVARFNASNHRSNPRPKIMSAIVAVPSQTAADKLQNEFPDLESAPKPVTHEAYKKPDAVRRNKRMLAH